MVLQDVAPFWGTPLLSVGPTLVYIGRSTLFVVLATLARTGCSILQGDQAETSSPQHCLGTVMSIELGIGRGEVVLDRLHAHVEVGCSLRGALAISNQLQHLRFPLSDQRATYNRLHGLARCPWEGVFTLHCKGYGLDDVAGGAVLDEVAHRPCLHGVAGEFGIGVHREDDYPYLGK